MTEIPDVQYAKSGDVSIAYQVIGDGPTDVVFVRGFTGDLLSAWDEPLLVRHLEGLASNGRLLVLDKRGTGLSDRVTGVPTIETRMDDVRAVMDAEGSQQAVLWSGQEGTHVTTFFAATYPERTLGLVLLDPSARATPSDDYPWAVPESEWMERLNDVRANWGKREYFLRLLEERAPDAADDPAFQDWFVTHMRRSLSPGAAAAYFRTAMDADISDVLPAVRVPTLILFSPAQRGPAEYFAGRIPDVRIHELPGMRGDFTWIDDATHERTMQLVREFVASLQQHARAGPHPGDVAVHGHRRFDEEAGGARRPRMVRPGAAPSRDGPRPGRAVPRASSRTRPATGSTCGSTVRLARWRVPRRSCAPSRHSGSRCAPGLHTGECDVVDGKCSGLSVSIGARVASLAGTGEILVSQTVKDLVAGSDLTFEAAGEHELKGVPDRWRLYRVAS